MGNWNISIRGVGAHHNEKNQNDADRMARRFVRELREAGHTVVGAEITYGCVSVFVDGQYGNGQIDNGLEDKAPDPKTS